MTNVDRAADVRLTIGLVGAIALTLGAIVLTPSIEHVKPYEAAFAGLPRLGLYLLAGLVLGLTGTVLVPFRWPELTRGAPGARLNRGDTWLGAWLGGALLLAIYNFARLRGDMSDELGPGLWIASIVLALIAVVPSMRLAARWPSMARTTSSMLSWSLLGILVAIAAIVRFSNLAGVPMNVQADEGDRAASALSVIDGVAPPSWFDSGWYYINMVYFRLLAATFDLLGVGVAQGRALSAVSGMLFIVAVAWIGCRQFSWRVGLVATALAATGAFILQYSRTIMESGIAATLWALSVAGFLEGARGRRAWPYALAGLCGGLGLYTYPSARLWVVGAVFTVGILWLFGRGQRWSIARGAVIAGVVALIAVLPFLAHLERHPNEATLRFQETTVLSPENQTRLLYTRPEMPLPELLAIQVERSLGMFDRYPDESSFLPTGQPLYPTPLAALTLLGVCYALARSPRDPRLAVLSVWFWLGLSGVILTVETPAAQRAAGLLVTLPLLGAAVLTELVGRLPIAARVMRSMTASSRAALGTATSSRGGRVTDLGLGLLVAIAMAWQAHFYFNVYGPMADPWSYPTTEGRQVAALGDVGPVYSLEVAEHRVNAGWVRFLARGTRTGSIVNPNQQLPLLATDEPPTDQPELPPVLPRPMAGDGMSFLLYGRQLQPYLGLLTSLYQEGVVLPPVDDRVTYQVPAEAVARSRGVTAHGAGGALGTVETFGAIPSGVALPGRLEWSAGVRVTRTMRQRFEINAPGAAALYIDAIEVVATPTGAPIWRDVVLAQGLHHVRLVADVRTPDDVVELKRSWASSVGQPRPFRPEETFAAMDAPWGLLGRASAVVGAASTPEERIFLDTTLAAGFVQNLEGARQPGRIVWRGTLLAPRAGVYRMAFATDAPVTVQFDGRTVDVQQATIETWERVKEGSRVELSEGPHAVEIVMPVPADGRMRLRWVWAPPLSDGRLDAEGAWSIVPPMQLRPETPVWPVGQEPAGR